MSEKKGELLTPTPGPGNLPSHPVLEWLATLATVFLSGATLTCLMRWFPQGATWDLGGAIFSGILTFTCYKLTLSERAIPSVFLRGNIAVGLPVLWAVLFPVVLWSLGFK